MIEVDHARYAFGDTWTHSTISISDRICYALEDTDRHLEEGGEKIYGKTAIPLGQYRVELRKSPHLDREVLWLRDVPGFKWVYLHSGNKPEDTDGCILPGFELPIEAWIGNSRVAEVKLFNLLAPYIRGGAEVWWNTRREF